MNLNDIFHIQISQTCFRFQVEISVGDINDSPPVFAGSKQYSTIIRKDWQAGSFVYQFQAVDKDTAENGKVNYFITDENKGIQK